MIPEPKLVKPPMVPERDVVKDLKFYWKTNCWLVVRMQQNIGSHPGIADYYVLKNGYAMWVEVKGTRGRQSPKQHRFEDDIRNHKGNYCVVRSAREFELSLPPYIREGAGNEWLR